MERNDKLNDIRNKALAIHAILNSIRDIIDTLSEEDQQQLLTHVNIADTAASGINNKTYSMKDAS